MINEYEKLVDQLENAGVDFLKIGSFSSDIVKKAELILNIVLPEDYSNFLCSFGACSFGSREVYGITNEDLDDPTIPNAIWYTLENRKYGLPHNLVAIGFSDLYIPCIRILDNEKYDVIQYASRFKDDQKLEKISDSFFEYFSILIRKEIEVNT